MSNGPNGHWNYAGRNSYDEIFHLYYQPYYGNWCIGLDEGVDACYAYANANGACPEDSGVWYWDDDYYNEWVPDETAYFTCS